ncbi:MAG TPA: protoheme IX farnesyltransferase [Saprospiraceae bacterium]|nr:protoheme IX farnesyltransferase [Saprospiraceae bacterium]
MNSKVHTKNYNLIHDLGLLVKFKLSLMVVLCSLLVYIIAAAGRWDWLIFSLLFVGGMFVTFGANILNEVLERDYDKLMTRTMARPLADGRMSVSAAVLLSGLFCVLGIVALSAIHPLAATLGMLSFILYAFVYTPLKRFSTLAIPVGAIPGALPALIASVAAQGHLSLESLNLFAIQYLWQFPHFWAIAWLGHSDYTKAGFKLIKDIDGAPDPKFGLYASIYSLSTLLIFIPTALVFNYSILTIIGVVSLVLVYALFGLKLYKNNDRISARNLMFFSFVYLPLVLFFFVIQNYLI